MGSCSFCERPIPDQTDRCPVCGWDQAVQVRRVDGKYRAFAEGVEVEMPDVAPDPHGQPYNLRFNAARRTERDLSEMLGLAKGMLADGEVNEAEARYLRDWGNNHPDALLQWPLNVVFRRLNQHFADGRVDEAERSELRELLEALIGGRDSVLLGYDRGTTLPLDKPAPLMCYGRDEVYVFTGRFAYGTRTACEKEVVERGSTCEDNITRRTTFLVIGTFGSRDWAQTVYGRKIQRAVELRDSGFALRIVGEDHWAATLGMSV
ncbi:MAG TPA: BRCT domain-containing protein [Vicinamibacterales bacterium]|nr:BRCT domain-containing protein [Vicinamibacterales bacterium]